MYNVYMFHSLCGVFRSEDSDGITYTQFSSIIYYE